MTCFYFNFESPEIASYQYWIFFVLIKHAGF